MGKRIPKSKKQKKLKFVDPCYSGPPLPVRGKKQKQWNEPPTEADQQGGGRHMAEFMEAKNNCKRKRKKKKKVIKDDYIIVKNEIVDQMEDRGEKKTKRVPARMIQRPHESEEQFLRRIQNMANVAMAEARVEEKYNVELVNVDKEGQATYKPSENVLEPQVERKTEKRKKQKEKMQEKKRLKVDDKEFDLRKEKIKFGEVANAPPSLKAKPRKAPELNKAGSRKLALHSLLPSAAPQDKQVAPLSKKLKTLPPEKRKAMENERLRAIQLYRSLKEKKIS
ncbi:hypothetical protein JTE90_006278 [Oedothorax gibbosus]|uniref:Coiled-coil domain-containing protein 137 n=1 Tax=Oedothorax gibbosus TaxID=931172 RepID=A0AAV6U8H1_9ARAC|nr:hypothetical protein JTE90_006278 [Oedothorax gibbosus]